MCERTSGLLRREGIVNYSDGNAPTRRRDDVIGQVPGIDPSARFESRRHLLHAGVHRDLMKGIAGNQEDGAESILLNGGYEDDADIGDTVVYTGHGGRDDKTGKQTSDQKLERGNLALARSFYGGRPIRVVRGPSQPGPHAPKAGFRYDGLFHVQHMWQQRGRSGFWVWRYLLVKID